MNAAAAAGYESGMSTVCSVDIKYILNTYCADTLDGRNHLKRFRVNKMDAVEDIRVND